ncbi:TetR/AcrR family transcriptional regulator [Catenuloplanes japonicus]|uniref:TetR/AcrR family transcriptional regulator n=1 Tax=Catenuloplanes japonicus TaxID=33876 RepID=UPI000523FEA2|nr:TetR/AcrR family transcriptional regulator [Catenuloplanes japonicus]
MPHPTSRERLQRAALELFAEHGYASVTAVAIAERAGVTERTLYRQFRDKRDVLFGDGDRLRELLLDALGHGPRTPGDAVRHALWAIAADFEPRREQLSARAAVVRATPELAERELWKMRSWAAALTGALTGPGVDGFVAAAHTEAGLGLFQAAFDRWTREPGSPELRTLIDDAYTAIGA